MYILLPIYTVIIYLKSEKNVLSFKLILTRINSSISVTL